MRLGITILLLIVAGVIIHFITNTIRKRNNKIIEKNILQKEEQIDRKIDYSRWNTLSYLCKKEQCLIDEITSNDVDMGDLFARMNYCTSPLGEEYLAYLLHNPTNDKKELERREKIISFYEKHDEKRIFVKKLFAKIRKTKYEAIFEYVDVLFDAPKKQIFIHYMCLVDILLSILLAKYAGVAGLVAIIVSILFNIGTYFLDKAYFDCYTYPISIIEDIVNFDYKIPPELESLIGTNGMMLGEETKELKRLFRFARIVYSKDFMAGDLGELFMDNVRMLTHIDFIYFHFQINSIKKQKKKILDIMYKLGYLESLVSVSSFRKSLDYFCIPEWKENEDTLEIECLYHPLIEEPVENSIHIKNSVLLTGSNASGKSTFLKTVALNLIMAQTVCTCTAKKFKSDFYHVMTSMALRDSLDKNESYYIAEIKAVKRIMDADRNIKVFCCIDEILRGTNTVERIASAAHILKYLKEEKRLCMAATHDIELTYMLDEIYDNYHFCETCKGDEVVFDYRLKEGRNTNRNAIKLLGALGVAKEVIKGAEKSAECFEESNQWSL